MLMKGFCTLSASSESICDSLGSVRSISLHWEGLWWWSEALGEIGLQSTRYWSVSNYRTFPYIKIRYYTKSFILIICAFIWFSFISPRLSPGSVDLNANQSGACLKKSNMTSDEYRNTVVQAKEHIFAGDIFQIVLSQRFERRTFADPFEVYRALRVVNPSPYMTYLQVWCSVELSNVSPILLLMSLLAANFLFYSLWSG